MAGESNSHEDTPDRWLKPERIVPDGDGVVSERDELHRLRKAIADMAKQRDALKRTAAVLIKEATQK